jgi:hypothetical protein
MRAVQCTCQAALLLQMTATPPMYVFAANVCIGSDYQNSAAKGILCCSAIEQNNGKPAHCSCRLLPGSATFTCRVNKKIAAGALHACSSSPQNLQGDWIDAKQRCAWHHKNLIACCCHELQHAAQYSSTAVTNYASNCTTATFLYIT